MELTYQALRMHAILSFCTYVGLIKKEIWAWLSQCRSRHSELFCKKGVLRNLPKFTEKHLCQSQSCSVKKVFLEISQNSQENTCARVSFLNKVVNFAKFIRTTFLTEYLQWLFLPVVARVVFAMKRAITKWKH